ncbi:MAG: DUF2267 domain-containing protein [Halopenitus sp.]
MSTMDTFHHRVSNDTEADSEEEVRETIEAVLSTLGQRISQEEGRKLAAFLPEEFETSIIDWESHSEKAFGVNEFAEHVADELDISKQEAHHRSQVVVHTFATELTGGEESKLRNQLPEEYDTLF